MMDTANGDSLNKEPENVDMLVEFTKPGSENIRVDADELPKEQEEGGLDHSSKAEEESELRINSLDKENIQGAYEPVIKCNRNLVGYPSDSSGTEDSSASSKSDTSSSSDTSESEAEGNIIIGSDDDRSVSQPPRTKDEVLPQEIPPEPVDNIELTASAVLSEVGQLISIVEGLAIVKADKSCPALDTDTVLFSDNRKALGKTYEVFGPVQDPFYSMRVSKTTAESLTKGDTLYYSQNQDEYTNFVFVEQVKKIKGSDASWLEDHEPPEEMIEYSDDEEERKAKAELKLKKRQEKLKKKNPNANGVIKEAEDTNVSRKQGKRTKEWCAFDRHRNMHARGHSSTNNTKPRAHWNHSDRGMQSPVGNGVSMPGPPSVVSSDSLEQHLVRGPPPPPPPPHPPQPLLRRFEFGFDSPRPDFPPIGSPIAPPPMRAPCSENGFGTSSADLLPHSQLHHVMPPSSLGRGIRTSRTESQRAPPRPRMGPSSFVGGFNNPGIPPSGVEHSNVGHFTRNARPFHARPVGGPPVTNPPYGSRPSFRPFPPRSDVVDMRSERPPSFNNDLPRQMIPPSTWQPHSFRGGDNRHPHFFHDVPRR